MIRTLINDSDCELSSPLSDEIGSDYELSFVCDKQETHSDIAGMKHITFFSAIVILLKYCLVCGVAATIEKLYTKGAVLCVNLLCKDGHKTFWSSQPKINGTYGNHRTTASIVFARGTYAEFRSFADVLKLQIMSEKTFYKLQNNYASSNQ